MLGQTIGSGHNGELVGLAEAVPFAFEGLNSGIGADPRMQHIGYGRFRGLIEFAEWPFRKLPGHEETRYAFGQHDKRSHARIGRAVGLVVRNIAYPFLAVPVDYRALGIPRLTGRVGRTAVVHDAPVGRPVETPA